MDEPGITNPPTRVFLLSPPDSGDLGAAASHRGTPLTQAHLLVPSLAGGRGQVAAGEPQLLSLSLWRFGEEGSGEGLVLGLLLLVIKLNLGYL